MTKEDYMQLSKERLAELLVERDNEPCITSPQQMQKIFPDCFKADGICVNPQKDCINCPVRGYSAYAVSWTVTTNAKDNL